MFDYLADGFNQEQFETAYSRIKEEITCNKANNLLKCTYILGGQPGVGKSQFYETNQDFKNYVSINGDNFRSYHPGLDNFGKTDADEYVQRTQGFSNAVVERLIKDLSDEGYNLVIEGTLRDADIPMNTCKNIKNQGYKVNLVVLTCDAELSWHSTLERASTMKELGLPPRIVPIDKYNTIIHSIPDNIGRIVNENCFDDVIVMNRNMESLYHLGDRTIPSQIVAKELKLDKWDKNYVSHQKEYMEKKIELLQSNIKSLNQNIR